MCSRMLTAVLFTTILGLTTAIADDDNKDRQALLGEWQAINMEMKGKQVPENIVNSVRISFTKDSFTTFQGDHRRTGTYQLKANKSPKQIDLLIEKVSINYGIYKIEEDKLSIVLVNDDDEKKRPKEFATKDENKAHMMILKRVK